MTNAEVEVWDEVIECVADFLPFITVTPGDITSWRFIPPRVDRHPTTSFHYPGLIIIKSGMTIENQAFVWKNEMAHEIDTQLGNSTCMHSGRNERCSSLWIWSDDWNSFVIPVCQ